MTKPTTSSISQRRGPVRNRPAPMALEQRLMFDAAGAVDVAIAAADVFARETAPAEPAALLPAALAPEASASGERREVAFVDTSVAGYQTLVAGIRPGIEVVLIDAQGSGLAQMADWAASHSGYDAIHVLGHGAEGQVYLGSDSLSAANIGTDALQSQLQQLGRALTASGDLLLYGCDVADGRLGVDFVSRLAQLTGADVAASSDNTGAAALGGDWTLEVQQGAVETTELAPDYDALLDVAPPAFSSAATNANGTQLVLTYDEALNASTASTGAFDVRVDGVSRSVSAVAVNGNTVVLTLGLAIDGGESVTVAYVDPTAGNDAAAVQDVAGNDAASFTSSAVNNTAARQYYATFNQLFSATRPNGNTFSITTAIPLDVHGVRIYPVDPQQVTYNTSTNFVSNGSTNTVFLVYNNTVTQMYLTNGVEREGGASTPEDAWALSDTSNISSATVHFVLSSGNLNLPNNSNQNINSSISLADLDGLVIFQGGGGSSDTTPPTASIVVADNALRVGETSLVTITFSEAVTGFTNTDLTIANGTLSAVSSTDGGITWTATFTPTAGITDATNLITLNNTGVADAAGNAGTGTTNSNNYAIDTVRPTASIVVADNALAVGETSLVTITFSEAVTGFTNADLTIANGTLSAVSSTDGGITWTATFTPTAGITDATNLITLNNTGVADAAGNAGTGTTNANNYAIDTVRPTAVLGSSAPTLGAGQTATITITLSESASDFAANDISVTGGTLSGFTGSGTSYSATFTPTAGSTGTATLHVASSRFSDAAGNANADGNDADNSLAINFDTTVTVDVASVLAPDAQTITEDAIATGNLLANDSDVDSVLQVASFSIAGDATVYTAGQTATISGVGTLVIGADGSYTFTPAANWNGSAPAITYTTNTGSSSTLALEVTAVADAVQVSSPVVNEASPHAVFSITGVAGETLQLQLTGGSASAGGTDFGASGAANLEVSTDGGATWQTYGSSVLMPAGGTLLARTPVIDDGLPDNGETFNLTATPAGGTAAIGTATIKDDGTGSIFGPNGQVDANALPSDDRPVSVSSPVVNEASPYAVFTVTGSAGQSLTLALAGGSASAGGTDFGASGAANLEVSTDGGATWQPYGSSVLMPAGGSLLARTPVIDDGQPDNGETFNLAATPAGGTAAVGTATIKDDGTGSIFGPNGQIDANAQPSDDRPVSVSSPVVNEASPYAVFTVTGSAGQSLSLALAGGSASAGGTDFGASGAANLEVSTDGGATWQPYGGSVLMPAGGSLLARTPITDDGLRDNGETFNLTATPAGGTAAIGTATIKDDGTGSIFGPNGQVDANALPSDDRPVGVSSPVVNEASPYAVFTVTGSAGQSLALALAGGSASAGGTDFGAGGAANLEVSTDGGLTWQTVNGPVTLPAGGSLLARTPITDDGLRDNGETFNLTATPAGGTAAIGTATIKDDGTGSIFGPNGQVDANALPSDDRPVGVSSPEVNEASPYAVFTVTGSAGQSLALALAGGSASAGGTDFGAGGAANLEVSTDGGLTWQTVNGPVTLPAGGSLLARTPITDDGLRDNGETFNLTATPAGGTAAIGTATIKDDGTGSIFGPNGQVDANALPSDDRPVSVSSPEVNEASPYAVFTVTGSAGQSLALALAGGSASAGGTDFGASGAANLEVSTDGGATWQPYGSSVLMPAGGSLLARTPITDDGLRDNGETFHLTATPAGGTAAVGTATIKDDGTGSIFGPNGQVDANALPSDDRPVGVSSPEVNEASPWAVFTVTGNSGQRLALSLAGGSAALGDDVATTLEYFDGSTWQPVTGLVTMAGDTLLVRVAVNNDGRFEGAEQFVLQATTPGGAAAAGTATLRDDGAGTVFNDAGQPSATPADDDRPQPAAIVPDAPAPAPVPAPVVAVAVAPPALPVAAPLWQPPVIDPGSPVSGAEVHTLTVGERTPDQFFGLNSNVRFALPLGLFNASRPTEQLSLSVEQADGRALPAWLSFNPSTRTFEGKPPAGLRGELQIKISARDASGNQADAMFRLQIGEELDPNKPATTEPAQPADPRQPARKTERPGRVSLQQQMKDLAPPRRTVADMPRAQATPKA